MTPLCSFCGLNKLFRAVFLCCDTNLQWDDISHTLAPEKFTYQKNASVSARYMMSHSFVRVAQSWGSKKEGTPPAALVEGTVPLFGQQILTDGAPQHSCCEGHPHERYVGAADSKNFLSS